MAMTKMYENFAGALKIIASIVILLNGDCYAATYPHIIFIIADDVVSSKNK
jgi:hypothetical protein